jgi:hypothetical protein|nr:hypothetical protein [Kofleriaceae bacterium]
MLRVSSLLAATLALGAATAARAEKPLAGTDHSPPRFVDESSAFVKLLTQGKDGYRFVAQADIAGVGSPGSVARLDWTQGGKVVATAKCSRIDNGSGADMTVSVTCTYDGKPIAAKGDIDAQLIWADDTDGKDYLIRDFKVAATAYGGGQEVVWQIVPDDLLGAAYVLHAKTKHEDNGKPAFKFWIATSPTTTKGWTLRCSVDGTKLADDFAVTLKSASPHGDQQIEADVVPAHGTRTTYHWEHIAVIPTFLKYGTAANDPKNKSKSMHYLGEHPGAWSCEVRTDHDAIRTLAFVVGGDGMIASIPMQAATGAAPLMPDVALIDITLPKDDKFDRRVRPDAMRKSRGFGLAWPSDPSVKTVHAAFPAASGQADPR